MNDQFGWTLMLAQEDAAPVAPAPSAPAAPGGGTTADPGSQPLGPAGGGDAAPPPPGLGGIFPILIIVMAVMIVFSMTGQRKEKKKRAAMIESLKKGTKVQTIGGMIGTIVEVRDDELVVKIDENSNTRVRFARTAIQSTMDEQEGSS